jgi:hypothetical protein
VALGYASDGGVTIGANTNSNDIQPWQSTAPIRSVITGRSLTMQFVLWQTNAVSMGLWFDTPPPTGTGNTFSFDVRSDGGGVLYSVGVDIMDGAQVMRIVFPRAQLSSAGDVTIDRGDAIGWDCTLTALDNAGVLAHVLTGPNA